MLWSASAAAASQMHDGISGSFSQHQLALLANMNVHANTNPQCDRSYVTEQREMLFCREGYDVSFSFVEVR